MGNCQAIDNATLVIQHPSGRVDKLYWPVNASEIMKMNPGHYVALLLTTTYCPPPPAATTTTATNNPTKNGDNVPVRITRIKLLRPTDTLTLGHVYRLITTQEVMKGLCAKKYAKLKKLHPELADKQARIADKLTSSDFEQLARRSVDKTNSVKNDGHRIRVTPSSANSAAARSRAWQPKLQSISEAAS